MILNLQVRVTWDGVPYVIARDTPDRLNSLGLADALLQVHIPAWVNPDSYGEYIDSLNLFDYNEAEPLIRNLDWIQHEHCNQEHH